MRAEKNKPLDLACGNAERETLAFSRPDAGQPIVVSHFIGNSLVGRLEIHGDVPVDNVAEVVLLEMECGSTLQTINQRALTAWFKESARL